jgi:outer membrane protein assembly factor BamB
MGRLILLLLCPRQEEIDTCKYLFAVGVRVTDSVRVMPGSNKSGLLLLLLCVEATQADNWPMFRGGPGLHGVASGNLPGKLELGWTFKTGGAVKSSAAIDGDKVFIGSGDGSVYGLSLGTGKQLWTFKTEGPIESSPLVLGGKLFCGSSDGFLYALDAGTGALAWKYKTEDKILGSPNWIKTGDSTRIVVGSYDYKLHCVDAQTGKAVWAFETGNYINGATAVDEGRGVFGGCDGMLHVILLAEGKQEKEIEAGAYVAGSAALDGGRAYFGQFENEFLCVDLKEGKKTWGFRDRNFPYYSSSGLWREG